MSNIIIGRYPDGPIQEHCTGYVQPEDRSWIIFLDSEGKPFHYYPERDASGAVIGEGVAL